MEGAISAPATPSLPRPETSLDWAYNARHAGRAAYTCAVSLLALPWHPALRHARCAQGWYTMGASLQGLLNHARTCAARQTVVSCPCRASVEAASAELQQLVDAARVIEPPPLELAEVDSTQVPPPVPTMASHCSAIYVVSSCILRGLAFLSWRHAHSVLPCLPMHTAQAGLTWLVNVEFAQICAHSTR